MSWIVATICAGMLANPPALLPQDGPRIGPGPIEDPLAAFALEFLETQRLERSAKHAVKVHKINLDQLPDPKRLPQGKVGIALSQERLGVRDRLVAQAKWTLDIDPKLDGQFTFHMHLAHFFGDRYRGGVSNAGLGMSRFNGKRHPLSTNMPPILEGEHRALAILSVRSVKTGKVWILDVKDAGYRAEKAPQ